MEPASRARALLCGGRSGRSRGSADGGAVCGFRRIRARRGRACALPRLPCAWAKRGRACARRADAPIALVGDAAAGGARAPSGSLDGVGRRAGSAGLRGGHLPHGVRGLRARRSGGLSADCRLRRRAGARGRLRRRARASALRRAAVQPLSRVQAVGARARPRVRRAAPLGSGEAGRPRQRRPCFACDRRYRIAGSALCSHVVPGDHRVRRVCGHDGVRRDDISGAGVAGSCILPAGGRSGAVRLLEGQRHGRARAAGGAGRYERVRA